MTPDDPTRLAPSPPAPDAASRTVRPRRVAAVRVAAATLLLAVGVSLVFGSKLRPEMRDFEVYYEAGQRAAAAAPLYRAEDGHYQFKYLPAFALVVSPLTTMSLDLAKFVWAWLSVALLAALLTGSRDLLPTRRVPSPALLAATIASLAKFYGHELVLGQSNLLLAWLMIGAIAAIGRDRGGQAGALAGVAVGVKPYAIVFLPYFLIVGRRDAALSMVAVVGAVLALPAAVYGWSGNVDLLQAWYRTVTTTTAATLTSQDNVSVFAWFGKWVGVGPVASALAWCAVLALGAAFVALLARRGAVALPEYLEIAVLLTLIPLLSPQGWDYVLVISTPLVMALVNGWPRSDRRWRIALAAALATVGLSLYDVLGRARYAQFMALSPITVCYVVLIAAAMAARRRQIA